MLLNPAQRNESALPSCTRNDQATQTEISDLFHGHKIAVAARGSLDNLPLAAQRTSDQVKRKLSSRHDVTAEQKPGSIAFKRRLQVFLEGPCSLNKDFSRFIEEDCETNEILVRLANTDGIYNQGFTVKADNKISYDEQHDPDVLFVPCGKDQGYVLAVYEKDLSVRGGQKTQWLTCDDVFSPQLPHEGLADDGTHHITRLTLSGDSKSLVCLDMERGGAFIGSGPGGVWVNKGNCMRYDQLLFSADSNHVAMTCDDGLCFMSKGAEGMWTKTGGIDHGTGRWEMAFSPDNHHLVAWGKNTEGHCSEHPGYAGKGFLVIIFAPDVNHQWAEKTRITRYVRQPVDSFSLKVGFSPDGSHLLVCATYEFDIWALSGDGHWLPSMVKIPYVCGDTIRGIDGEVIFYSLNPRVFMLLGIDNGSVWGLQSDGSWSCRLTFFPDWDMLPQISPDGRAIVCKRSFDKNGLWLEQPNGQWNWQRFDFDGQNPRFNQVGSLLAIKESTQGALIFMGPDSDGRWSEKVRLQLKGELDSFDFSSHGRSIQVQVIDGGQRVMMILDIVANSKRVRRRKEAP